MGRAGLSTSAPIYKKPHSKNQYLVSGLYRVEIVTLQEPEHQAAPATFFPVRQLVVQRVDSSRGTEGAEAAPLRRTTVAVLVRRRALSEGVSEEDAAEAKGKLEEAGAAVEVQ